MPAKIKICGIKPEALDATIGAGGRMPGWCSIQRRRAVTSNVMGALTSRAAGQIAMVGLFVDADDAVIADALVAAKLNALQLHGSESPERVAQLRARLASRCGRRCPSPAPAMSHAPQPMPGRRTILFDAKDPKGALPGGVGVRLVAAGRISRCLAVGAGRRAKSDRMLPGDCAHQARWSMPAASKAPGRQDTDKITNSTKPSNT